MNGLGIKLDRDDVTPRLQKMIRGMKNPQALLRAVGVGLVGLTKETFNNADLRPIPWAAKKDGTKATLKSREATLWRSIRVQAVTKSGVTIGTDRPYGAIHQLGGKSRPMPARPYFPFHNNKLTKHGEDRMAAVIDAYVEMRGNRR